MREREKSKEKKDMKKLVLIISTLLLLTQPIVSYADTVSNRVEGTIYVGDSRFNGMEMYLKKGEGYIVAKDSMGYKWLVNDAIPIIDSIKLNHPEIKEWTLVSGLGVNDLYNLNNYIQTYRNLEDNGYRVVVVSVNPTNGRSIRLNEDINKFNQAMINSGLEFLNINESLWEDGFKTVDGVHYDKETYTVIWNEINQYLLDNNDKEVEDELKLKSKELLKNMLTE